MVSDNYSDEAKLMNEILESNTIKEERKELRWEKEEYLKCLFLCFTTNPVWYKQFRELIKGISSKTLARGWKELKKRLGIRKASI